MVNTRWTPFVSVFKSLGFQISNLDHLQTKLLGPFEIQRVPDLRYPLYQQIDILILSYINLTIPGHLAREGWLLRHSLSWWCQSCCVDSPAVQVEVPGAFQQGQGSGPVRPFPPRQALLVRCHTEARSNLQSGKLHCFTDFYFIINGNLSSNLVQGFVHSFLSLALWITSQ